MIVKIMGQTLLKAMELNEIGTGQQVPHDFDWTEA